MGGVREGLTSGWLDVDVWSCGGAQWSIRKWAWSHRHLLKGRAWGSWAAYLRLKSVSSALYIYIYIFHDNVLGPKRLPWHQHQACSVQKVRMILNNRQIGCWAILNPWNAVFVFFFVVAFLKYKAWMRFITGQPYHFVHGSKKKKKNTTFKCAIPF